MTRPIALQMPTRDPRGGTGRGLQGITAKNSNTRISASRLAPAGPAAVATRSASADNLGLNSERLRGAMIERLRSQGITDERVLGAMQAIARHAFVDEALASRAYDDAALPIGHGQTISQPWVVARMISAVCEQSLPARILEVGTGCGYQAAAC